MGVGCTPIVEAFFESQHRSLVGHMEFPRPVEVEHRVERAWQAVKEVPAQYLVTFDQRNG